MLFFLKFLFLLRFRFPQRVFILQKIHFAKVLPKQIGKKTIPFFSRFSNRISGRFSKRGVKKRHKKNYPRGSPFCFAAPLSAPTQAPAHCLLLLPAATACLLAGLLADLRARGDGV
jgi:hypothetical protein